ncbi:Uncharacterized protein APZ42_019255 [Daphnia magna]|uniref:Uncharacterized protein n=1 Tax=Daphnia magna TaxID=35525 RepID=A0A164YFJ4_9CRUS|nr:Uncharacterized protein APZ42_019255 [Daphnia magna]
MVGSPRYTFVGSNVFSEKDTAKSGRSTYKRESVCVCVCVQLCWRQSIFSFFHGRKKKRNNNKNEKMRSDKTFVPIMFFSPFALFPTSIKNYKPLYSNVFYL